MSSVARSAPIFAESLPTAPISAHVVAVGDLLLLGGAALHPHGQEDDDEDRESDEPREAKERRQ